MSDKKLLRTPFENDPFALVWRAFKNLYPERDCTCYWDPELSNTEDGEPVYGATDYDAETDSFVVLVSSNTLTVKDSVEILAHELAHVAVGEGAGHGPLWEEAFEAIFQEYNRIGDEMFGVPEEFIREEGVGP